MTFLVPLGLAGLLALPLILVLHLVRRRRRQLTVPSLQWWTISTTPLQRRRQRLPLTLLLLLHLLIAALIGMSLGRPRMPGAFLEPTHTVIVIDTSSSMAARDTGTGSTRFAAAQREARAILAAARREDRIALVTLAAQPRLLGYGGAEAAGALLGALAASAPAGPDGDLHAALSLAAASNPGGEPMPSRTVILSDTAFAAEPRTGEAESAPFVVQGDYEWRTFGEATNNVALVAFATRPLRSGGYQLYARVANYGERTAARTLTVSLDDEVVETEPIRLDPNAEAEWSWPLPRSAEIAEARLSDGDAFVLDDGAATVLVGSARRRVQLISAKPTPLERSLRAQPGVEVRLGLPTTYQHDPSADLAVFVDFLPEALPPIPTLIVGPPRGNTLISVDGAARDLRADSARDSRFGAIDLRSVLFTRAARVETPEWAQVAIAAGDTPLILTGVFEDQPRTVWTFDPATSKLAGRLAFPLLTAATLRTLLPDTGAALAVGEPAPQSMNAPDGSLLPPGTVLTERGLYRWTNREGAVAVNAPAPAESDLRARPQPTLTRASTSAPEGARPSERALWRPLLAAALILLLAEWLYSHRHEFGRAPSRRRPA